MKTLIALLSLCFSATIFAHADTEKAAEKKQTLREVSVDVSINSELMPENPKEWILYIYASQPGARLPLALAKTTLDKLPMKTTLNESMYLLPHLTLKQAEDIVIIAKATKSDNPHRKSKEDMIGTSQGVSFASGPHQSTNVVIDNQDGK